MSLARVAALAPLVFATSGCVHMALMLGAFRSADEPFFNRGSFARTATGRRVNHCIEVRAERYEPTGGLDSDFTGFATRWQIGNACDAPQTVTLGAARAWSQDESGAWRPVGAVDARGLLGAVRIEADITGSAVVEYTETTPSAADSARRLRVCFDVSGLAAPDRGATAVAPICLPVANAVLATVSS